MPLYYETDSFRAVHACWDSENIAFLRSALNNDRLNETALHRSVLKGANLYRTIDETLKGKEVRMPDGLSFFDKDATERNEIRIKWWQECYQLKSLPQEPFDISMMDFSNY